MSYGVLLTTDSGEVWVSPESSPLALVSKKVATYTGGTLVITQTFDADKPMIPFARINSNGTAIIYTEMTPGTCSVKLRNALSGTQIEVYFFTIFTQQPPDYGLAIWDENKKCILTNETRTLADLVKIGGAGNSSNNGIGTNQLMTGKWACMPDYLGIAVGIITQGGTRPWQSSYRSLARAEGSKTRIIAYGDGGTPVGVENLGFTDGHAQVIAIDVSRYQ